MSVGGEARMRHYLSQSSMMIEFQQDGMFIIL